MKISFDFDGTLDRESIQRYAKDLVERGFDVWIVTSRYNDNELFQKFFKVSTNVELVNTDVWKIAEEVGIPKEKIHFTNMTDKWNFFKDKDFVWHLDDDWVENRLILSNTKTKAISSFGSPNWKAKCERIIRKNSS